VENVRTNRARSHERGSKYGGVNRGSKYGAYEGGANVGGSKQGGAYEEGSNKE
jgi:hypothetical protein